MLFDLIRNTTSHKERTKRNLVGIHKGTLWDTGHGSREIKSEQNDTTVTENMAYKKRQQSTYKSYKT